MRDASLPLSGLESDLVGQQLVLQEPASEQLLHVRRLHWLEFCGTWRGLLADPNALTTCSDLVTDMWAELLAVNTSNNTNFTQSPFGQECAAVACNIHHISERHIVLRGRSGWCDLRHAVRGGIRRFDDHHHRADSTSAEYVCRVVKFFRTAHGKCELKILLRNRPCQSRLDFEAAAKRLARPWKIWKTQRVVC